LLAGRACAGGRIRAPPLGYMPFAADDPSCPDVTLLAFWEHTM
jgi:hypothetical protein